MIWLVESRDILVRLVLFVLGTGMGLLVGFLVWHCLARTCARRQLASVTGTALLVYALGLTTTVAKRTGTTGVSPVDEATQTSSVSDWESRHLGGDSRSNPSYAPRFTDITPTPTSVWLSAAWQSGTFLAPPFIEFYMRTNLVDTAMLPLGWAETASGETNICVEIGQERMPGETMPPTAFFTLQAYDGLGGDGDDDDGDGLSNAEERVLGTNPLRADTDGDGIPDGVEASFARYGTTLPAFDLSAISNAFAGTQSYAPYPEYAVVNLPFAVDLAGQYSTNVVLHFSGIAEFMWPGTTLPPAPFYGNFYSPSSIYGTGNAAVAAYGYLFMMMGYTGSQLRAGVIPGTQGRWFVAEWRDMADPNGWANYTFDRATFLLAVSEAEPDTVHVRYMSLTGCFDGSSAIIGAHGFGGTPDLPVADGVSGSVTSGMTISYHFGTGTNPTNPDSDGDGLPDGWEAAHGMDPLASNTGDPRTDASADPDLDGLTNAQEAALGTDPFQPDSDGDGMDDGWESRHGFDPTTHNDDTHRTDDDADADPDGDGLTNAEECAWGTNPSNLDTDNDEVNDGSEIAQGSDPADGTDDGKPNSRTPVQFYFGDHSSSCSEKYRLTVAPVVNRSAGTPRAFSWVNARYDQCETRTAMLTPGYSYEVRLAHASTNRPQGPDYDYTLNIVNVPQSVVVSDPDGLLGVHSSSSTFTGEGLVATIHALAPPQISAPKVIGVNNDDDNGNGTPDYDDEGELVGDDDIVEVTISARCPEGMTGTLTIRPLVDLNAVSIWRDRERTELEASVLTFPVSGSEGTNQTFYIEGYCHSASYMFERLQASLACGSATSTNEHRFTVVERIAEPITTERVNGHIANPCCAIIGEATPMKVQVLPSNFPDSEIKWRVVSGSGTLSDGGTGRIVSFTATGSENSEAKLQVDVGDCPGRAPQLTLSATAIHEVLIYPCAIHLPDEEMAIAIADIESMMTHVNAIYRQIGLHFSLNSQVINLTNELWAANGLIDASIGTAIRNIMSGTGGIEVYFIPGTGLSDEPRGSYAPEGIIIRNSANAITLAHEIGHACGWHDICRGTGGGVNTVLMKGVRQPWMPYDWNNGTGRRFYDQSLFQSVLIPRLLMYEYGSDSKCDIPAGGIYGLTKSGEFGLIAVGRNPFMTLTPSSL